MAVTKTSFEWTASSSLTQTVPFEVIAAGDIDVYVEGVLQLQQNTTSTADATHPQVVSGEITQGTALTNYTVASNNGSITFNANLTVGDFVVIERSTDDTLLETFTSGSTVRARDLNSAFERVLFIAQEGVNIANEALAPSDDEDDTLDAKGERISNVADATDDDDAVNRAQLGKVITDDLVGGNGVTLTDVSGGTNSGKQTTISVPDGTADVKGLVKLSSTTPITTAYNSAGDVTLSIAADSIDLDRIKNSDIVTSSESNPNNDTTIATTAKIDDMIDAAITGDIAVSDGLSVTDDGDGTITIGISANSVDLDRLKNDDIITLTEQDAGPTTNDSSIFTSSAAAKRFDTLVQTGTPSGSYQVGKTWLQNDDDQTLKIWNGSTWLDVASGGSFRTQDKVIYVDATGGDDTKTGHRISGPKLTIKAAIADINADVDTSIESAGSGYTDGSYPNVPLTGGTSGSGLQANITVTSGAVTACTVTDTTTLEDYQIGDILSAADSDLGGGGGAGFELKVTGNGDGMTVIVAAGDYEEAAPIQIKRRNVSIIGMALRSTIVHPSSATQGDHADGNNALFELNSGSFIQNLTLTGMQAGTYSAGDPNSLDSVLPKRQGWNFALYDNCVITKSPYIQNCTNFSDSQIVNNSDFDPHNPAGGQGGDLTNAPTGGGMLIDGSVPHSSSPLRSMVADSYTHVGLNGPGILVTKNGYLQATSSYAFFNKYHIKALNGGQANLAASTTDFGEKALVADGKSTTAIFSGLASAAASAGDITVDVDNLSAGTGWFGDDNKPASNMLVTVTNSDSTTSTYPILSAAAITGGYRVTISRPNTSNRSQNDGLEKAVDDNAAIQFFLRSQIASSGHTMEYVGSGMDYDALPENGGVPDETKQITELNDGKIWTAITDHNGKFKIGGNQTDDPIFEVDQQLGFITIPTGSIAFDLLSDTTPQLGGNLDVQARTITTSTTNGNITLDPNGTGVVDVNTHKITNLVDPTADQDASTKKYVDDTFVQLAGSTLTGELDMDTNKIVNVGDPTNAQDATTKNYVDTNFNNYSHPNHTGDVTSTGDGATVIADGAVTNAKVSSSAAIAGTKISPNFGSQNVVTTGSAGIGTTSPNNILSLDDTQASGGVGIDITNQGDGGTSTTPYVFLNAKLNPSRPGGEIRFGREDVYGSESTADSFMAFYTAVNSTNTERLRIDSSGNVGIGTTSPDEPLHISASDPAIKLEDSDGTNQYSVIKNAAGDSIYDAVNGSGTAGAHIFRAPEGSSNERMRIDSSGNVGIGTTSPGTKLEVKDTTVGGTPFKITGANNYGYSFRSLDAGNIDGARLDLHIGSGSGAYSFTNSNAELLRIDSSGNIGIGTDSPGTLVDLKGTNARLRLRPAADTEVTDIAFGNAGGSSTRGLIRYDHNNELMFFETNGSERVRIDSNGRLLVGTSSTSAQSRAIFQGNSAGGQTSEIYFAADTNSPTGGLGNLYFSDNGHNSAGIIACVRDGGTWTSGSSHPVSLQFYTTADSASSPTERVRIGSAGQIGIGGANYGTSGQVLTSNGASSAPSWQDASGGGGGFETGMIMMFTGSTAPSGWAFCDGQNGTPDLRDRFIVGAGSTYSAGSTGGSADAIIPSHTHTTGGGSHSHNFTLRMTQNSGAAAVGAKREYNRAGETVSTASANANVTINSAGESATGKNLPPYYALAFIMKT